MWTPDSRRHRPEGRAPPPIEPEAPASCRASERRPAGGRAGRGPGAPVPGRAARPARSRIAGGPGRIGRSRPAGSRGSRARRRRRSTAQRSGKASSGLPGGRQGQPQVDADPLVVGGELRGRSEQPFGVGPPPLEVIAVARVIPDLRVFRAELEGFLVVDLGLGELSQPIEAPPIRRWARASSAG